MSASIQLFSSLFALSVLFSCSSETIEVPVPEPIGGRDPEVIIYVSDRPWFPATIGIVLIGELDDRVLHISANSSANKGYQKQLSITLSDENLQVPDDGILDYWENVFPIRAHSTYKEFRDNNNTDDNEWRAHRSELVGIRVDGMEKEDDVVYASGEFFMNAAPGDLIPANHQITGLFNNIRVFDSYGDLTNYFDQITALELAKD